MAKGGRNDDRGQSLKVNLMRNKIDSKSEEKGFKEITSFLTKMTRGIIDFVMPIYILFFVLGFVIFSLVSLSKTFGGALGCIGSAGDLTQCFFLGRSVWDWIGQASGLGIITGLATFAYTLVENNKQAYQKKIERDKLDSQEEIEKVKLASQEKMRSIKDYYDAVDKILVNKDIDSDEIRYSIIGSRTVAILPELRGNDKVPIINYLVNLNRIKEIPLETANLSGASFWNIDLSGCRFRNAQFQGTFLNSAQLKGANLNGASLNGAHLSNADLRGADLKNADLGGADLRKANFTKNLDKNADLTGADLTGADLTGADLRDANLSKAIFSGAKLSGAKLSGAKLSETIFLGTDLRSTDGTDGLVKEQFTENNAPLRCNSPLPNEFKIDKGRDCDKIKDLLKKLINFQTNEEAERYFNFHNNEKHAPK